MSYPQFQAASDYLGAIADEDYVKALPSNSYEDRGGAVLDGPEAGYKVTYDFSFSDFYFIFVLVQRTEGDCGIMEETKELITADAIRSKVYILRGQQVMLDQDLAEIYGYQVKNLNQQVKRNLTRFPEDFMFHLNKEEVELVKSQFVTSRNINYFERQEGGHRKLPYAFTEQGIYMLETH